jgi:Sep-tRNA:Cys-tRNA synthetase
MTRFQEFKVGNSPSKEKIVVQPIMTGGVVPKEVQKEIFEGDWMRVGYSACFDCLEGRSGLISKPPVREFLAEVAKFYGGDSAEHTFGCRAAQFTVMRTVTEALKESGSQDHNDIVLADPLCHYTTALAAEINGLQLYEPPNSGYPEYRVTGEDFAKKIEEIKKATGKLPALIALTHAEPYYGNLNPAADVGKVAKEYGIPYMINGAYTAGVAPLNMRELEADFLTVSAHKSMASLGPLGFVVTNYEWAKKAFKTSTILTEWTRRAFGKKLINLFGCSIGGVPLISSMGSFPYVMKRVERWDSELEKTNWFIQEMEKFGDLMLVGERPHRHHLLHFETPIFWEISKQHKRRGFFLAEEMEKKGIIGLHKGLSKHFKISLYGLSWDEVRKVRDTFYEVADRYNKEYNLGFKIP